LSSRRFPAAVDDIKRSLEYKVALYAADDSVIAEAYFKLSLALEFASLAPAEDDKKTEEATDKPAYNKALRDEAVDALESAIKSSKLKLQAMEVQLATSAAPDENEQTRAQIADVRDVISDMEDRVSGGRDGTALA
jgi:HAT1-interacting factor 1